MFKIRTIATALPLAALALASATPAQAAGIPVIDPANIAQTIKVVQSGMQQLQAMQAQLKQVTDLKSTMGQVGKGLAASILKDSGLSFNGTTSPLADYKAAMPGILDALPTSKVGSGMGISSSLATQAKTNIEAGRNFAIQAFYKNGDASNGDIAARRGVRQAALRDSSTAGYAMAVYTKNDLTKTEETMKNLSQKVQDSTDLRTDVAANTAVQLATLRQVTVTNQLLAQLLEVNATTSISVDDTGNGTISK